MVSTIVSVLEIKQKLSRLSIRERTEIQLYLHQLKQSTPAWKKATAKKLDDMSTGNKVSVATLRKRLGHG